MQRGILLPYGLPITLPKLAASRRQIERRGLPNQCSYRHTALPRRRITAGRAGRVALLHAIAHMQLNAIDMAIDMACRFVGQNLPKDFYNDWLGVADDESRHFLILRDRLTQLGANYGDLPAHDRL